MKFLGAILLLTGAFFGGIYAQERCLGKAESDAIIAKLESNQPQSANESLTKELLKMRLKSEELEAKLLEATARKSDKTKKLLEERVILRKTNLLRLCGIIKENGWLTWELVTPAGVEAALFIIRNNQEVELQAELLPVLAAATNRGLFEKGNIASIVDNIRVGRGLPQIFGTQAKIRDNILYLYPLLNENQVNEWRKQYNLPPLAEFIRDLERRYTMPVLKTSRPSVLPKSGQTDETALLGVKSEEEEVLKVDTGLVNLNVRVFKDGLQNADNVQLQKEDFAVFENGQPQEISFFSNTDKPFDLILLLDFSGSTVEKQGLIKKAAQRFVEVARPTDRVAVVVFTEEIKVISDLTTNKAELIEKIKQIKMTGGSRIWDSLDFVYKNIIAKQSQGKRSAVIFMTDALDGSEKTTFADLVETVRQGDTTIFPVFLDPGYYQLSTTSAKAKNSMAILAAESGGELYPAKNVKDLVGIYEKIISDLSRIYSISYEPTDGKRDGAWREISIKVKSQPDLVVKTRQGYYAN